MAGEKLGDGKTVGNLWDLIINLKHFSAFIKLPRHRTSLDEHFFKVSKKKKGAREGKRAKKFIFQLI